MCVGGAKDGRSGSVRTMNLNECYDHTQGGIMVALIMRLKRPTPLSSLVWVDDDTLSDDAMKRFGPKEGFGKEEGSDIQQCC